MPSVYNINDNRPNAINNTSQNSVSDSNYDGGGELEQNTNSSNVNTWSPDNRPGDMRQNLYNNYNFVTQDPNLIKILDDIRKLESLQDIKHPAFSPHPAVYPYSYRNPHSRMVQGEGWENIQNYLSKNLNDDRLHIKNNMIDESLNHQLTCLKAELWKNDSENNLRLKLYMQMLLITDI